MKNIKQDNSENHRQRILDTMNKKHEQSGELLNKNKKEKELQKKIREDKVAENEEKVKSKLDAHFIRLEEERLLAEEYTLNRGKITLKFNF